MSKIQSKKEKASDPVKVEEQLEEEVDVVGVFDLDRGSSKNSATTEQLSGPSKEAKTLKKADTSKKKAKKTQEQDSTEDEEWEVEAIVGSRVSRGMIQYELKWKGWDTKDNTWESEKGLAGCAELLAEYKAAHGPPENKSSAKRSTRKRKLAELTPDKKSKRASSQSSTEDGDRTATRTPADDQPNVRGAKANLNEMQNPEEPKSITIAPSVNEARKKVKVKQPEVETVNVDVVGNGNPISNSSGSTNSPANREERPDPLKKVLVASGNVNEHKEKVKEAGKKDEEGRELEAIVGRHFCNGVLMYELKWKARDSNDNVENTWSAEEELTHCADLIAEFVERANSADYCPSTNPLSKENLKKMQVVLARLEAKKVAAKEEARKLKQQEEAAMYVGIANDEDLFFLARINKRCLALSKSTELADSRKKSEENKVESESDEATPLPVEVASGKAAVEKENDSIDEDEWVVEMIVGSRVHHGVMQYELKWKGRDSNDNTWCPHEDLNHCSELLTEYHKRAMNEADAT